MAHGSRYHRRPGSMGPVAPNRVFKGKNLAGRMGGDRVTIQNLEVVQVVPERTLSLSKVTYQVLRNLLSLSSQQLKLVNNKERGIQSKWQM